MNRDCRDCGRESKHPVCNKCAPKRLAAVKVLVGDHTGRCRKCGSNNLWDDNLAYGCNDCGAFLGGN